MPNINFIDNLHRSDMSVPLNQGLSQAIDQILQHSDLKRIQRADREDAVSKALDGKSRDVGISLLQDFFSKAGPAKMGFLPQRPRQEAERQLENELKQLLGKKENFNDSAQLTRSAATGLLQRMYTNKNEASRELKNLKNAGSDQKSDPQSEQAVTAGAVGTAGKVAERDAKKNENQPELPEDEAGLEKIFSDGNFREIFKLILARLAKTINLKGAGLNPVDGEGQTGTGKGAPISAREVIALLNEYAGLFLEYLLSNDSGLFQKLKNLEDKLRSLGVSLKEIIDLQLAIKNSVRKQITEGIRTNMVGRFLTENKAIDHALFERGAFDWIESAFYNNKLGSWDFGNYQTNLQNASDEMGQRALEEVAAFLSDELEKTIIQKVMAGDDLKNDKELKEFIKLSRGTGFDAEAWIKKAWPERRLHYGLNTVDLAKLENQKHQVVAFEGDPLLYQAGADADDKKHEEKFQKTYEVSDEEEKDILVSRLRALYLRRVTRAGGFKKFFETLFEIKQTKDKLYKLGLYTRELDEQIKKEARVVARTKFMEMLKDSLDERATLYEIQGTAYKSVEHKVKGILKNAARLGLNLTRREFGELVDTANRRMFEVGKQELENVYILKQTRPGSKFLENKEKLLLKLLERLAKESKIGFDAEALYALLGERYLDKNKISIDNL